MTIEVLLPRVVLGSEVIQAFKKAGTFVVSDNLEWTVFSEPVGSKGTISKGKGYTPSIQCFATPVVLHTPGFLRRWVFGAEPSWKTQPGSTTRFETQVSLKPVSLEKQYSSVSVSVAHEYESSDQGGFPSVTLNPDSSEFASVRPYFDKIMSVFLGHFA